MFIDAPERLFIIVTGTIGRTTSSEDDTDRDAAVAASHAVAFGEMTFGDSVAAADAVDEDVGAAAAASSLLLKGASGTLFPCFASPLLPSFSSFFL